MLYLEYFIMKINNLEVHIVMISEDDAGQRVDNFLHARLKSVPKSMIYRIIRKGAVRINKKRIQAKYKLIVGDLVRIPPVRIAQPKATLVSAKLNKVIALDHYVLYEDDQILILNKPSGIAVHGGSGISVSVIEGLRVLRLNTKFLELVHRLDRDTSGVLLIAKRRSALRLLHEQLRTKGMHKDYLALVRGQWPTNQKVVQVPLLKNILYNGKRVVSVNSNGKNSETRFKIKTNYKFATLIKASPITGRTHQIRVHTLHAGHPIAFDDYYGDTVFDRQLINTGLNRLFLHASMLHFEHPTTGKIMRIEAPMDGVLNQCLEKLHHQKRCNRPTEDN